MAMDGSSNDAHSNFHRHWSAFYIQIAACASKSESTSSARLQEEQK